ncbi:MAG: deoxyhypusine synthase family protein [Promethearchaeota archaeon]
MKHHKKEDYLTRKIIPFDVKKITNINDLLNSLKNCGFQGKRLGIALDLLYKMVSKKEITTVLTLSGAMVPAGMGELICALLENKLIDVLVTTGANITHDLINTFSNGGHFIGSENADDSELFHYKINRIYDVFLPEENYKIVEIKLLSIIRNLYKEKQIEDLPSNLLYNIGASINERCILSVAAKNDIPIFIPAFSDSEFALNLILYGKKEGYDFHFDILGDVTKFGDIIKNSKIAGTLIIGGGVPRNWVQQVYPLLDKIDKIEKGGYDYCVRIHTAVEYDGGLSGCTISESKSWGKYKMDSKNISVWCDATIALPILITGLMQKLNLI